MKVPLKVTSACLGHSTTQITQDIYQHLLIDMGKDVADKIDTIFAKNI
jgi:integrase